MKVLYFLATIPFYFLAKLFQILNLVEIYSDLKKCESHLNSIHQLVDDEILNILFIAEDHRISRHFGIDHYAMFRAVYYTKFRNQFQGASTVAQQYVRVITERYERTWIRKFREQLLAILICKKFSRKQIATAYLKVAFLGSGMNGIDHYLKKNHKKSFQLSKAEKIEIVARLKYPEPLKNKEIWRYKMKIRINNISCKLAKKSLPTSL
ncbi:transglycosylase domain-containing protein [Acinetobacter thermotolerans]|uniref:transglycosylase domain-containing protein n=1 Tax=Acinetobacter thermotolerans TaxID=3151487 RepID=UPI00325BCB78